MSPRLGHTPGQGNTLSSSKQIVDNTATLFGTRMRAAQEAVQARGPLPGSQTLAVSGIAGIHNPVSDRARSDIAADPAGGRLVSGGDTFLSQISARAREADNDDHIPADEESRPHLLSTTKGRYDLRHGIASLLRPDDGTRGPAVCGCGRAGHEVDDVNVHLSGEGRAYVSGVYKCDSAWLCPTCAPRRAFEIQERLTRAVEACIAKGGSVWFVTPTVRRLRELPLAVMKKGFQTAWRDARQGAGWVKPADRAGILGLTNVLESPWSPVTGWGLHGHTLIFFDHRDSDRARTACDLLLKRFLARLPEHGLSGTWSAQDAEECFDAEKAAKYCAKIASELAHGWIKEGRKVGSTSVHPFAIAARATLRDRTNQPLAIPGLERVSRERCRDLFREYAEAMPGTRLGLISPSLARKLGIEASNDEEEGGVQQLLEKEHIGRIPSPTWDRLIRRALAGTFLNKVETECDPDGYGWEEVEVWALQAGAEDSPGDDDFLRRDPPLQRAAPLTPDEVKARDAADRMMASRRLVVQLRGAGFGHAGTLDLVQRAIADEAAANRGMSLPTPAEVIKALANAARAA